MTESGQDIRQVAPLSDGEVREFSLQEYQYGKYSVRVSRNDESKSSSVTLISEEPLDILYQRISSHPDETEEEIDNYDEWYQLYFGVSSTGKVFPPQIDRSAENRQYKLVVVSNHNPTKNFNDEVIKPMAELGIIPQDTIQLFE